jgi:actin
MDDQEAMVIDHGSYLSKVGIAGDEHPRSCFSSVVGRSKYYEAPGLDSCRDTYVGDDAEIKADILRLKYVIERGRVTNWDDMDKIWEYTFHKALRVDPAEHPVLVTEPSLNPKFDRERTMQLLFETFNVPSYFVASQGVLSMYANNQTTGVVLEIGDGICQVVPMYEGALPSGPARLDLAGRDLHSWLRRELAAYAFDTSAELLSLYDIKQKLAYVALDFEMEKLRDDISAKYKMPNGTEIVLGYERFGCGELLFEEKGVHELLFESIMKCDPDIRKDLYANIVLSGGTTMLTGFAARLEKEIVMRAPRQTNVRIVANPDRRYGAWMGGSQLANLAIFPQMVITRDEYNEDGPAIVHRKCPL